MKRLVLCCDGTWNHAVNAQVSNIEKLARSITVGRCDGPGGEPVTQMVGYVGGVGARGYLVDRLLGGAFGYGFTRNVVDGYRFLAMNYAPGDEIVVLGYSRGAYTARSVVGMVSQLGLLKPEAVDAGHLDDAERVYRLPRGDEADAEKARFRAAYGREVPVHFLGVFDTVGALGVPGFTRRKNRFHDVSLSPVVLRARQALAIDERRITFAPCLWSVPDDDPPGRVEQVWFPGTHGDVGGGSDRCGLSDLALQWMADELATAGVALDERRLARQLRPREQLVLAQTPPLPYRLLNVAKRCRPGYATVDGRRVFSRGLRVLALPAQAPVARGQDAVSIPDSSGAPQVDPVAWRDGVRLADNVLRHVLRDDYAALAPNLARWVLDAGGVERVPVEQVLAARADLRPLLTLAALRRAERAVSGSRRHPRALPAGR